MEHEVFFGLIYSPFAHLKDESTGQPILEGHTALYGKQLPSGHNLFFLYILDFPDMNIYLKMNFYRQM